MKLLQVIVFCMAIGLLIVGVHQSFFFGIKKSYWIFMFSLSLVFLYGLLKNKNTASEGQTTNTKQRNKKKKGSGKKR